MKGQQGIYKQEENHFLIELKLADIKQLFNALDPSPFREKDLADTVEDYIFSATSEFSLSTPLKLLIHLPEEHCREEPAGRLAEAIHHYFHYRSMVTAHQQRQLLQNGRISLLIGLSFLFMCILAQHAITGLGKEGLFWSILQEGFLISGWVAMWHPINLFLYEWWPYRHRQKLYNKIAQLPVELRADQGI